MSRNILTFLSLASPLYLFRTEHAFSSAARVEILPGETLCIDEFI